MNWRSTWVLLPAGLLVITVVVVIVLWANWDAINDNESESAAERGERAAAQQGESIEPSRTPADAIVVELYDFEFEPNEITVSSGESVAFVNDSPSQHIVVIHGAAESPDLDSGEVWEWTAGEAGTFDIQCQVHPEMTGTLTVE